MGPRARSTRKLKQRVVPPAVDVEIAEHDDASDLAIVLACPIAKLLRGDFRELFELRDATGRYLAEFDVCGHEGETHVARVEPDDVRRSVELLGRIARIRFREHDLPR